MSKEITVYVPEGTKVKIEETANVTLGDKRIPTDRDIVVKGAEDLKLAIKRVGNKAEATSAVVTMCG